MRKRKDLESALYGQALDWAACSGYFAWRQNSGRRGHIQFGFRGQPDICGFYRAFGRSLFIECKRQGERLTEEQWVFLNRAHDSGCDAFIWTETERYTPATLPDNMKPKGTK